MTRREIIQELEKRNITFKKVIFKKISPYMARRYKGEYVNWEAWIYTNNNKIGYLITSESLRPEVIEETFNSIKEV